MSILQVVNDRGISEILHFTTSKGLLGILYSREVLPRRRLPKNKLVEHVYMLNAAVRYDPEWTDYVNLSIARINARFFDIASKKWHGDKDLWWCVLSFSPVILTHDGVVFTTTNNAYSDVVERSGGVAGLDAMFAERVTEWPGRVIVRSSDFPDCYPTCRQAEVLYPGPLSTDFLKRVYVVNDLHQDIAYAQAEAIDHRKIEIAVDSSVFES
jgi:hypothetical protein